MITPVVKIDVRHVKCPVVRDALASLGNPLTQRDPSALIVWSDGLMPVAQYHNLAPHQRVNRIPGMDVLYYQSKFLQGLARMRCSRVIVHAFR
jgi:hypothetical protein